MKFDKRTNRALFLFLIFINFTIRFLLLGNHEEGSDSFLIHGLANSISNFGYAKWIIHPLSYFGFTPLSYPCAVPYFISGLSQIAGVDMETSILMFSFMTALIGMGSAYLMALEIKRDHMFAFLVGFIFSLAPIFVEYTMWQATTRSLFMAFLPLLVWSLMRTFGERPDKIVNIFICIIVFSVLGTIHHMFLLLPLFLIAYFSTLFTYKWLRKKKEREYWIYRHQTVIMAVIFLIFFIPQFTQTGIYSTTSWKKYETGLFFNGTDKHIILLNMLVDYWSRTGLFAFMGLFGLLGLIYRPRKKIADVISRYKLEKTRNEIFLIFCLLITIPFATMGIYVSLIFLPFFCVIIAYFILQLIKYIHHNRPVLAVFFVFFIILSSGFTVFMNVHWNVSNTSQPMSERTYSTSIYVRDNFENPSVSNNGLIANRIIAISEIPCLPLGGAHAAWYPPDLLVYEFADVNDYTFKRISFDAVILTQSDFLYTTEYGVNAKDDWVTIMRTDSMNMKNEQLYNRYDLEQVIEFLPLKNKYYFWSLRDSVFLASMENNKYILYDNGEYRIWLL